MEVAAPSVSSVSTPPNPEVAQLREEVAELHRLPPCVPAPHCSAFQISFPFSAQQSLSGQLPSSRFVVVPLTLRQEGCQVYLPLYMGGKCPGQVLIATSTPGQSPSRLFFVSNRNKGLKFLVDMGAEVSVLPSACCAGTPSASGPALQAAN